MITETDVAIVAAVIAALAAIASAVISALFGISISKRTASQKLAEMRQLWIEDLRNHLAEFVGSVHRIMNESSSKRPAEIKEERLEKMNADVMRLEAYISMKLNHDETPHARLANVVGQTRGASAIFSHSAEPRLNVRIQQPLGEIDELSRFIFKVEWNKASDEIRPVVEVTGRNARRNLSVVTR